MGDPVIHGGPHTKRNSLIVWGLALVGFLVLELTGLERRAHPVLRKYIPWFTLSETDWLALSVLPKPVKLVVRILLVAFFSSLGVHFALGTPLVP